MPYIRYDLTAVMAFMRYIGLTARKLQGILALSSCPGRFVDALLGEHIMFRSIRSGALVLAVTLALPTWSLAQQFRKQMPGTPPPTVLQNNANNAPGQAQTPIGFNVTPLNGGGNLAG